MLDRVEIECDNRTIRLRLRDAGGVAATAAIATETTTLALADVAGPLCELAAALVSPASSSVACRVGCAACCRQLVTLSLPEAFAILDFLDARPPETARALERRADTLRRRLDEAGLLARLATLGDPALDDEAHHALARDYHRLTATCPFLTSENRCGIYPVRPAACRAYFVVSPPERCEDPFATPVEALVGGVSARDVLANLAADLTRRTPVFVALPLLFDRCERETEIRQRRWTLRRMADALSGHLEAARKREERERIDEQ